MPFQTRNPYYLRISQKNVLPLYLYLDERHLTWMDDLILQHVLADLRPHILHKLRTEANMQPGSSSKKPTVDTHRGGTYQFCYFFRKTYPHSVVVKSRNFIAVPKQMQATMPPPEVLSPSNQARGKRRGKISIKQSVEGVPQKKRKIKGKARARFNDDELSTSSFSDIDGSADVDRPRRSTRTRKPAIRSQRDSDDEDVAADIVHGASGPPNTPNLGQRGPYHIDTRQTDTEPSAVMTDMDTSGMAGQEIPGPIEIELEEEEKPKLTLQLKYQGFDIYGSCLCIVVEPWPPIRAILKAPSVDRSGIRASSIVPAGSEFTTDHSAHAKTPLFLPEFDQGEIPAPFPGRGIRPPINTLLDSGFLDDSEDSDYGGMMEFSQALNVAGDFRAGAADDDDDTDAVMFFGDADEVKEL